MSGMASKCARESKVAATAAKVAHSAARRPNHSSNQPEQDRMHSVHFPVFQLTVTGSQFTTVATDVWVGSALPGNPCNVASARHSTLQLAVHYHNVHNAGLRRATDLEATRVEGGVD